MINALDLFIAVIVLAQARRWVKYGFVRGILSLGGFWIGFIIALLMLPFVLRLFDDVFLRFTAAILILFIGGALFSAIGQIIGTRLHNLVHRLRLGRINTLLGLLFSIGTTLIVVWLLAAILTGAPYTQLNRQIRGSLIISTMNNNLPPAPGVLARIGNLINPARFPQVFIGLEPRPLESAQLPDSEELRIALEATGASTVRIESFACGGLMVGSGFVADVDTVVTNAHVVAGADSPFIVDRNGTRRAEIIYYDPDMDLAILRAGNLAGNPLDLELSAQPPGTNSAVVGYPGGETLEITAASVIQQLNARGRNIYGESIVNRPVYALQTDIVTGNSGGPVVLSDGRVIGVVFARSESHQNVGYAITSAEVQSRLNRALEDIQPVSAGRCMY